MDFANHGDFFHLQFGNILRDRPGRFYYLAGSFEPTTGPRCVHDLLKRRIPKPIHRVFVAKSIYIKQVHHHITYRNIVIHLPSCNYYEIHYDQIPYTIICQCTRMCLKVPDFVRIYQNVSEVPESTRMYLSIMCASRSETIYILEH